MVRPLVVTTEMTGRSARPADYTERAVAHYVGGFIEAVDKAETNAVTLVIDRPEAVAANVAVPATVRLEFQRSGRLVIAAGVTVTIASPENIRADVRQQIFECQTSIALDDGAVAFTRAGVAHVGWWGAVADGATENTQAIQRALIQAAGGRIEFAGGVYLTDGVDLGANTEVYLPEQCTVKLIDDATDLTLLFGEDDNITIHGRGTLDANMEGQAGDDYVHCMRFIDGAPARHTGLTIEDIRCINGGRAISVYQYSQVRIRRVRLEITDGNTTATRQLGHTFHLGIYCIGADGQHEEDYVIQDCLLTGDGNNGDGIILSYIDHASVRGNLIDEWGDTLPAEPYFMYCVDVEHAGEDIAIVDNVITGCHGGGIAGKGDGLLVANNIIEGSDTDNSNVASIYVTGTASFVCEGNSIRDPSGSGIAIGELATAGAVLGNRITGVPDASNYQGVSVLGGEAGLLIEANQIIGLGDYVNSPVGVRCSSDADGHLLWILGNHIEGFDTSRGIYFYDPADSSVVAGNTIIDCAYGVSLRLGTRAAANNVAICDNEIVDPGFDGVQIIDAAIAGTDVDHNRVTGAGGVAVNDAGTNTKINRYGAESANAETPTAANWDIGDTVDFTDTGDGSGDGVYTKLADGSWSQIGT